MIKHDPELEALAHINEIQERDLVAQEADKRRQHELEMTRLSLKTVEHRKIRERILVALLKAPSLIFLMLWLPALTLANREVPQYLQDYLSL